MFQTPVYAATSNIVPSFDITSDWPNVVGTNDSTCSGGPHCDHVDEGATANTADYIGTGTAGSGGEVEEFGLTNASNVLSVSQVSINVHAQSATNANGSTLDSLSINLRINGTLQTAGTCTPAFNTWAWCSAVTFNGTWTQSDLDSMQVQITRNRLGSGGPSAQDDDVRIASVYAAVTYSQNADYTQASHRWFGQEERTAGVNWISRNTPAADNNWNSVTYGNGLFVAVATSGTGNRVMTSPDGTTWTPELPRRITTGTPLLTATACLWQ